MKIELECCICDMKFFRHKSEHNRNTKIGRKTYCSRKCAGKGKYVEGFKPNTSGLNIGGDFRTDEFTPFRWHHNILVQNRQAKGVEVTLQDLKDVWDKQEGKCPFTGHKLTLRTHSNCHETLIPDEHASVDRIDNDQGYSRENIRFVSVMANIARNKFTDDQLIDFCCNVAEKYTGTEI